MQTRRISDAHFQAELGVEIGEGFVEEEGAGANDQGARQGDALLLTTGELGDLAVGVLVHVRPRRAASRTRWLISAEGTCPLLEAEGNVLGDGHVRPERVALEHHAGVAFVGRKVGDVLVAKKNAPILGNVEAGDVAERGWSCRNPRGREGRISRRGSMRNERSLSAACSPNFLTRRSMGDRNHRNTDLPAAYWLEGSFNLGITGARKSRIGRLAVGSE